MSLIKNKEAGWITLILSICL
ncbi:hypothetical protein YPPY11_0966, partial [Yersinia pestis PY-11]